MFDVVKGTGKTTGGFHSILLHGQGSVVNFPHVAVLCVVEVSKFR